MIIVLNKIKEIGVIFESGNITTNNETLKNTWSRLKAKGVDLLIPTQSTTKELLIDSTKNVEFSNKTEGAFAFELENLGYSTLIK